MRSLFDGAWTSMSVTLIVDHHPHSISIGLSVLSPPVEAIIESLPLSSTVSEIVGVFVMEVHCLVQLLLNKVKVIANLSLNFSTVKEDQELWLISSVEEKFHLWGGVAVDLHVGEPCVIITEILVIWLNLLADWVPGGVEIKASESWLVLVHVPNNIINTFWYNKVLTWDIVNRSRGNVNDVLIGS